MEQTIAVTRSYNIGISMGLQSVSQLNGKYGEAEAETILNNCDTVLFFGGRDAKTIEKFEKEIGQQTVTTDNQSKSHAQQSSWSEQEAQHARALKQSSELAKMPRDKCIVMVSNMNPFEDKKYSAADHPMFKWTSPGKGRMFTRKFDFAAYRSNHQYFREGDAAVKAGLDAMLFTSEPIGVEPPFQSVYNVTHRLHLKNDGAARAYHLRGTSSLRWKCLPCDDGTVIPAFEKGAEYGSIGFERTDDTRSSRMIRYEDGTVDDVFEYNRAMMAFELRSIELEPAGDENGDDEVFLLMSHQIDGVAMREAVRTHPEAFDALEDGRGQDICAKFEFVYEADIECANSDPIRVRERHILSVDAYGKASIGLAP